MKTVYIDNQKLNLYKEIGGGQEAIIFDAGNRLAIKAYRLPHDRYYQHNTLEQTAAAHRLKINQKKLASYPKGLPKSVVTPIKLVTNKKGVIIGYMMPLIDKATTLLQYGNKLFREQNKLDNNFMNQVLLHMHPSIEKIHSKNTIIGDFNDSNVMIRGKKAYFIDTDSWDFGGYPCTMFTNKFVDPLLCKEVNLNGSSVMTLDKAHTYLGDWYAYNVMVFKSLLYVDPYGGTHKPKDRSKKVKQDLRPLHRTNLFHQDVVYPKPAKHFSLLPDDLLHHFEAVFSKDKREIFPKKLLENMRWTTCSSCHVEHARPTCPTCATINPNLVVSRTQVRGTVKAQRIFTCKGVILASDWQKEKMNWIYYENNEFLREDKKSISSGTLNTQMRYRLHQDKTLFASSGNMIIVDKKGNQYQQDIDAVGNLPIMDSNSNHMYWIANGEIKRENKFGLEYEPDVLGTVIKHQTLIWTGKDWGFGLWRAEGLLQGFIFDDKQSLINEQIQLPSIKGSILDAITVFGEKYAWFLYTSKIGSKLVNTCILFERNGNILKKEACDDGEDHWLGHIRGKDASGPYLFSPSDNGIIRTELKNGVFTTKEYPDTANFIDSQSTLHITPKGIYVRNISDIYLLTIK